ncbi:AraC family ligand binding domain-containing protein [Flavobacteriaceae bacterium F89]|uniref:AraC family ligand binding domain-containing protein n=1 Tax=Cerina litoralis TaxID=2874477 RepID=A0AAE3EVN1_9FLAO|nr:cupin domain-containing protein [Cerina litoralis]MCG2461163.1 AraC family ligand binding domain-containing protein [Cerina litoralis]
MEKVTRPNIGTIATGKNLVAKQMQAKAGDLLPKHRADKESILFLHEGECVLKISGEDILLKTGEGYVIPPEIIHQIKAVTDFKGLHFMPIAIKIEFF